MSEKPPVISGGSVETWATRIYQYLIRTRSKLAELVGGDKASEDGLIMWDRDIQHPVVSVDGEWVPLGYGGAPAGGWGYGSFLDFNTQSAATVDTPTAITWGTTAYSNGISIDATYSNRIVFERAGLYHLYFTAELHSESANTKTFYFWPRINGTDITGSTMVTTLHNNDQRKISSRSGLFEVEAGDYLEAMFATDDLDADLHGVAATAFSPAAPSVTIVILGAN